ncbi:MAG: M56 family metallopeptidase [Armatimonadetes bacterium]|nr:M56 family metallopeptidase [Armatimonadota bacterium]
MNSYSHALGWTLVHFAWQGFLIAGITALILRFANRISSAARYTIACGMMALMPLAAIATFAVYALQDAADARIPLDTVLLTSEATSNPAHLIEAWIPSLVIVWSIGLAVFSIRFLGGLIWVKRLKQRSEVIEAKWRETALQLSENLGLRRLPDIRVSESVAIPVAFGWLRAVVLIPAQALTHLDEQALRALIAHELAHLRRYDYIVNLLQTAIETVLFYHPAVWWVSSVIRQEREHACDDLAIKCLGDRVTYARALAQLAEFRGNSPALTLASNGGSLMNRIQRIAGIPVNPPRVLAAHWVPALMLGMLAGPIKNTQEVGTASPPAFPVASIPADVVQEADAAPAPKTVDVKTAESKAAAEADEDKDEAVSGAITVQARSEDAPKARKSGEKSPVTIMITRSNKMTAAERTKLEKDVARANAKGHHIKLQITDPVHAGDSQMITVTLDRNSPEVKELRDSLSELANMKIRFGDMRNQMRNEMRRSMDDSRMKVELGELAPELREKIQARIAKSMEEGQAEADKQMAEAERELADSQREMVKTRMNDGDIKIEIDGKELHVPGLRREFPGAEGMNVAPGLPKEFMGKNFRIPRGEFNGLPKDFMRNFMVPRGEAEAKDWERMAEQMAKVYAEKGGQWRVPVGPDGEWPMMVVPREPGERALPRMIAPRAPEGWRLMPGDGSKLKRWYVPAARSRSIDDTIGDLEKALKHKKLSKAQKARLEKALREAKAKP